MWELPKVAWGVVVLRDAAQRGKLNWRKSGFVVGFVVPWFIAAMVLAVVNLVVFVWLAWRLRSSSSAA